MDFIRLEVSGAIICNGVAAFSAMGLVTSEKEVGSACGGLFTVVPVALVDDRSWAW